MSKICDVSFPSMTYLWPDQKFDALFMTWYPISYQNGGKMVKIDTLFMTKTAEKPYPFGAAHTYIAHIRGTPRLSTQTFYLNWVICLTVGMRK